MAGRGTQRNGKKKTHRPKKPKPSAMTEEDRILWAQQEMLAVDPLIDKGNQYLEEELDRLTGEPGQAKEVKSLVEFLWKRQQRAISIAAEARSAIGAAQPAAANRDLGRYDLSRPLGAD